MCGVEGSRPAVRPLGVLVTTVDGDDSSCVRRVFFLRSLRIRTVRAETSDKSVFPPHLSFVLFLRLPTADDYRDVVAHELPPKHA